MSVIYNFYICNDCGFTHDDEEVDCSECSGKSCVVIYQTETIEEAWEQSVGKIKKKCCEECGCYSECIYMTDYRDAYYCEDCITDTFWTCMECGDYVKEDDVKKRPNCDDNYCVDCCE